MPIRLTATSDLLRCTSYRLEWQLDGYETAEAWEQLTTEQRQLLLDFTEARAPLSHKLLALAALARAIELRRKHDGEHEARPGCKVDGVDR